MKREWFSNVRGDLLAGAVVAVFTYSRGDRLFDYCPSRSESGYASFTMVVTIAFFGGRMGMISAATGAMALLITHLVKDYPQYGLQYLCAATILTGIFQILWGVIKIDRQINPNS